MSRKRKKKRERMIKQEIERNRGKVYCTIKQMCTGGCAELNFRRNGRTCGEAFYRTGDGDISVKS